MLIEDNKLDQLAFRRLVEEENLPYDYTIAGSVSEAQNKLSSDQFDIVISDYSLGSGTALEILDLVKNTPVVVVTGAGNEEIAIKAWRAGAYDYLIKDIERSYLKALPITVGNALRHKQAEEKLRLLSAAIMNTGDSVYITDMDDKIIFVNKAFCATYGYNESDVLGKDGNILWIGKLQSANTRSVFRTRTVRGTWEVGFYHKRKDGSIFPVSLSRSTIREPKGNQIAIVATARDITERVLVEDALREANQKLNQQNQLKNDMAMHVSESLMQILTSESLTSTTLQNSCASEALTKVKRIVANFLETAKINAGQIKLEHTKFDLGSVISETIQTLTALAEERQVQLINLVSDSRPSLNCDPYIIGQTMTKLLGYAINSARENSQVKICADNSNGHICLTIHTKEPYVKSIDTNTIFDRRAWIKQQREKSHDTDWSLGLFVAQELAQMHGGSVWAETTDSEGYSLCFSVPILDEQQVTSAVTLRTDVR